MSWMTATLGDLLLDAGPVRESRVSTTRLGSWIDEENQPQPRFGIDSALTSGGPDQVDLITVSPTVRPGAEIVGYGRNRAGSPINRSYFALFPNPDRIDPRYLFWTLRRRLEDRASAPLEAGSRRRISLKGLLELGLELPPLDQQRRRARLLDGVERLRALRIRADDARAGLPSAIYRRRFALEAHRWEQARLGDLVDFKNMSSKVGIPKPIERDGMLLIRMAGTHCGRIDVVQGDAASRSDTVSIAPRAPTIEVLYLAETLRQVDLSRFAVGSVTPHLSLSTLGDIEVPVPPLARQRRFAIEVRRIAAIDQLALRAEQRMSWLQAAVADMAFGGLTEANRKYAVPEAESPWPMVATPRSVI